MKKGIYGICLSLAIGILVQCARINAGADLGAILKSPVLTPDESGDGSDNSLWNTDEGEDDLAKDAPLPGPFATIHFNRACGVIPRTYYQTLGDALELRLVESHGVNNPACSTGGAFSGEECPIHFRWALPSFPLPKNYEVLIPLSLVENMPPERLHRLSLEICKETAPPSATRAEPSQCLPGRHGWAVDPFIGQQNVVGEFTFIYNFYHAFYQTMASSATGVEANCDLTVGSPLVLDLEGNGIALFGPESGMSFDLDGDGLMENVGWTRDAFLALDRNGNRRIDDGTELFGSYTFLKNGERAKNGFAALEQWDLNGDKLIDWRDTVFSKLLLWQDTNFNGLSEPGEIESLGAKVSAISLNYIVRDEVDRFGNESRERAIFWDQQGVPKVLIDIWFAMISR